MAVPLTMIAPSFPVSIVMDLFEQLRIEPIAHEVRGNSPVVFCNECNLRKGHLVLTVSQFQFLLLMRG